MLLDRWWPRQEVGHVFAEDYRAPDLVPQCWEDLEAAVGLYRQGPTGAAAEWAGVPKPLFLTKLSDGVDTFSQDADEYGGPSRCTRSSVTPPRSSICFRYDLLEVLPERFDQVLVPEPVVAELDEGRRRNVALPMREWVHRRTTDYRVPLASNRAGCICRKRCFCWTHARGLYNEARDEDYRHGHGMAKKRAIIPSVSAGPWSTVFGGSQATLELAGEAG